MTWVICKRLQNLLSTCRAIQSSHINAHTNACFEHHFVRSTASSVFLVRAEISGHVTEWVFYCSCQLRSSGSWGGKAGKTGPFPSDCATKRCACSMPCVFMAKQGFILTRYQFWGWSTDEWRGRLAFLMASPLCTQEENLSCCLDLDSDFCWGANPGVCCLTFQWNPLEFGFHDPLQISWFLSAENPHCLWISLVNGVGTLLRKKKN